MVASPLGADRVTGTFSVDVPLVGAVIEALPTLTVGSGFGLVMVSVPAPPAMVALVGDDSVTLNAVVGP